MIPAIILYALVGTGWGAYCVHLNRKFYEADALSLRVFITAFLFWPLSMLSAALDKPRKDE